MRQKKITAILLCCIFLCTMLISCKKTKTCSDKKFCISFRLAETHPYGYPTEVADRYFADLVETRSEGRIKIEVFSNSQLGQEKDTIEQVQFGGIDFARVSIGTLSDFAPQFNALQMPYIFRNDLHSFKVLDGEIGEMLLQSLEQNDLVGLCYYDGGARSFYNTVRPIYRPEDLKGLRIRVQQNTTLIQMIDLLGARAIPLPYGDVYSNLQTDYIQGAENNWSSYESTKHYKIAKYIVIDEHTRLPEIIIGSKKMSESLCKEDLNIVMQAAKDSTAFQRNLWHKEELLAKQKVINENCIVTEPENIEDFQKAMQPIYDRQTEETKALIKRIKEIK